MTTKVIKIWEKDMSFGPRKMLLFKLENNSNNPYGLNYGWKDPHSSSLDTLFMSKDELKELYDVIGETLGHS